jgi:hypothetical protein
LIKIADNNNFEGAFFDSVESYVRENIRDEGMETDYTSTLITKYMSGCTTPDTIKEALPESWMTKGVWKISGLAMKNIIKQRFDGATGKPHFLIQELLGLMIDCLDENYKSVFRLEKVIYDDVLN